LTKRGQAYIGGKEVSDVLKTVGSCIDLSSLALTPLQNQIIKPSNYAQNPKFSSLMIKFNIFKKS
jgi:hypothetical protein